MHFQSKYKSGFAFYFFIFFRWVCLTSVSRLSLPWWALLLNGCSLLHKNSSLLLKQDWESAAQHIADYLEILLVYTIQMVTMATLTGQKRSLNVEDLRCDPLNLKKT